MEGVEFVQSHQIDVLFDETNGEKVAGHIQVHASVAESRIIFDAGTGNLIGIGLQRPQLEQSKKSMDASRFIGGANGDALWRNVQRITCGGQLWGFEQ